MEIICKIEVECLTVVLCVITPLTYLPDIFEIKWNLNNETDNKALPADFHIMSGLLLGINMFQSKLHCYFHFYVYNRNHTLRNNFLV